jgi:hypothetical protein
LESAFCPISAVTVCTSPHSAASGAREFLHCRVRGMHGNELLDLAAELHQFRAHVAEHLAAQQVHGLDRVGALVDHVDARIAHVLL